MRRLYLQVYFTIVASLVLVVITAGLLWHFSTSFPPFGQQFEVAGEIIAELVPPADAPPQAQQEAIERLAQRVGADLALFSRTNEPLGIGGTAASASWSQRPNRRLAANGRRAGHCDPAPGRAAAGGTHPVAATPGRAHARGVPWGHRARGRARRRSRGETAHRTARAAAARRRVARSRRPARPGQSRRPR